MSGAPAIFPDTAHVLAVTNERDQWHTAALRWSERIVADNLPLITTEFALIEIGNALAAVRARKLGAPSKVAALLMSRLRQHAGSYADCGNLAERLLPYCLECESEVAGPLVAPTRYPDPGG